MAVDGGGSGVDGTNITTTLIPANASKREDAGGGLIGSDATEGSERRIFAPNAFSETGIQRTQLEYFTKNGA